MDEFLTAETVALLFWVGCDCEKAIFRKWRLWERYLNRNRKEGSADAYLLITHMQKVVTLYLGSRRTTSKPKKDPSRQTG